VREVNQGGVNPAEAMPAAPEPKSG
jgi:hypothetical protein